MAYARYATSDTIYALNDDTWEVEILQDGVQSQNHKFEVGPAGVQLIYESPEDDILVPGIVHSRCEVETIWPPDVADELEDMIESMVDSEDGVWFMQVYKNGNRFWFGPILIDEVQLQETSAARACRIVASDGISLLKTVDYNDNGSEYETDQIIFDDVLTNIQEKWVSYEYADFYFSGAERRLAVCDDMYSQDIYTITTTPSGTQSSLTRKMKLGSHMFSYTNDDDEIEFVNCYELLESICKTLLLRLYYYEQGWWLMPCYNQDTSVRGNVLNWSGVYTSGVTLIESFNYQIDTLNNEKQKGNEWNHTFTPAINEVTITRDTNNGSIVLGQTQITGGSSISAGGIQFTTGDSGYILYGNCLVERSALDPTVNFLNELRAGRYVLALEIRFGSDPTEYQYYENTIEPDPQGVFSVNLNFSGDGNSTIFTPFSISSGEYTTGDGNFHWHNTYGQICVFDSNEDSVHHIFWNMEMPPVPVDLQGVQVTAGIFCFDRDGVYSQTLQDTIDTQTWALYFTYGQDTVQPAPSYDVVANSTFGRGSIDLGKTYIGELHQNVGGIMVETSAGVFQTSQNWSTQRYDYDDECNQVGVREVLAAHYKPRAVERGNIVMRGNGVAPPPFYMFIDDDTTDIYQCINYRLASTPAEVEVTLHKIGTDGQAQTTTTSKDYGTTPIPNPNTAGNIGPGQAFAQSTSNQDFNDDAADAFGQDYSSVFTGETIEGYVTYVGPSKGQYFDFQTNTPPTGYDILRKIYTSDDGFADASSTWHEIHSSYRPAKNETLRNAIKKIDEHTARTTNPDRSFIITYQTQGSGLLDEYANAQAAYSLRKISSSYTGNAIKVRNDSGTTLDIGFDSNGDLDTASLQTHIGTGNGTVQTWYDQSGNGRNATQIVIGLQPFIALSGTIHEVNSKPAIKFSSDYLDTAAFAPNPNDAVNQLYVCQFDNVNTRHCVASQWSTSSSTQNYVFQMSETVVGLRSFWRYDNGNSVAVDDTGNGLANYQYLASIEASPSNCRAYYNGSLVNQTSGSIGGGTPNNASRALRIGALSTSGTQLLRGYLQEFVMWSNTSALDIQDISDDVNDYYEVF